MKDRQHSGQKKNDKGTSSDLHNTTQKTKDRATRTPPQKTGGELGALEGLADPAPHVAPVVLLLLNTQ